MTPEQRAREVMVRVFGVPDPSLPQDRMSVYVQVAERGYGPVERALVEAIRAAVAEEREACVRIADVTTGALHIAAHGHGQCSDYALQRRALDEARGALRVSDRLRAKGGGDE